MPPCGGAAQRPDDTAAISGWLITAAPPEWIARAPSRPLNPAIAWARRAGAVAGVAG